MNIDKLMKLKEQVNKLKSTSYKVPKFETHEEASEWMLNTGLRYALNPNNTIKETFLALAFCSQYIKKPVWGLEELSIFAEKIGCEIVFKDIEIWESYAKMYEEYKGIRKSDERPGLSEETCNMIRAKILGIDNSDYQPNLID